MEASGLQFRAAAPRPSQPAPSWRVFRAALKRPAPAGAYAGAPAWWGREQWLTAVACALRAGRDVCREEHVLADTVKRIARAHAAYAEHSTGRECRPTNERLAENLGMSVRQIQRGRRVLKRLALLREVVRGRSYMTRAERLAAWRTGSAHRRLAAEFALTSPRVHPQGCRCAVERVTPPALPKVRGVTHLSGGSSPRQRPKDERPAGRRNAQTRPRTSTPAQHRTRTLIARLQRRVPWLSGASPARLTSLHRFAAQGWTERDVITAVDQVLNARGWTVPDVTNPPAYLAALLRHVDPADRPGAYLEQLAAERQTERAWQTYVAGAHECAHGYPAGDVEHFVTGVKPCPYCRLTHPHRAA